MKQLLKIFSSLGMYKILGLNIVATMFILVILGPTMLRNSQKQLVATTPEKTAQSAPTQATGGTTVPSTSGFDPSYFNVTPIKQPDGSITFPSYDIPSPTYSPTAPAAGQLPDPDKCQAARDGIAAVDASYVDEDAQLQQQVKDLQTQIIAMTTIPPGTTSPGVTYNLPDTSALMARLQTASNKLMSNVRDANNKKAAFQQQINQYCG